MKSLLNTSSLRDFGIITISLMILTLLIWLPHYLRLPSFYGLDFSQGFETIYRNFDGANYIVISKSLYHPEIITKIPNTLSPNYYAAHFPGYALAILALSPLFGYLKSMLLISLLFTLLSTFMFYLLVKNHQLTSQPLWLSLVFLVFPARWLIVHSVGSAEPIFIFFVLGALYFGLNYLKNQQAINWLYIGIFGMFAQISRPPGILLGLALGLWILFMIWQKRLLTKPHQLFKFGLTVLPILLIPITLLGIFSWYSVAYQDFWAYFNSGDNIHLVWPPFQVFNINQYWVGDIWLEDIVYIFSIGFLAVIYLFRQKLYPLAFFALVYLVASSFVTHRDISRYVLPIYPLVLIAFEKLFISKPAKIVLVIMLLGIYLYAQNYILQNTAPIPNLNVYD